MRLSIYEIEDFKAKLKGKAFDAVIDTQALVREHVESAVTALEGNLGRYLFVSTGSEYFEIGFDFFKHCPFKETDLGWSIIGYSSRWDKSLRCRQAPLREVAAGK